MNVKTKIKVLKTAGCHGKGHTVGRIGSHPKS